MAIEKGIGEAKDQFPVGMRVLAVDDDPTCLLLLQTLLRRCQYNVTTTSNAITALKLLRDNKNMFDLVISDVHMPDMDGFKLLELVGLEMDLPVIMLSANSDPKLVMKGITHGACDYLLKPVRIEELKTIWQHVVRRRKIDTKDLNNVENRDKPSRESGEASLDPKLTKKRKDQNEDEDENHDEDRHENEDPATQKKPRVVWSVDLHRKFVAAVNQLGIDKAVPKKILELMNVEKLTRENVASHLQKYRLYLKRISTVANQQANMVAALRCEDASYLQMNSMNGLGLHNLATGAQFHTTAFRPLSHGVMLGRLNSPASLGLRGLPSPGVIPIGNEQSAGHSGNSQNNFQSVIQPGKGTSMLQGMPLSVELDQMQPSKCASYGRELSSTMDDTATFPISNGFPDSNMIIGSSSITYLDVSNRPLMLEELAQADVAGKKLGKQSSFTMAPLDSVFSTLAADHGRCNESWSSATPSVVTQSNSFMSNDHFKQPALRPSIIGDCMSKMALQGGTNHGDVSSVSSLPIHLQNSKADLRYQVNSVSTNNGQMIQNTSHVWDDMRLGTHYQSNAFCSSNSTLAGNVSESPRVHSLESSSSSFQRTTSFSSTAQSVSVDPSFMRHNEALKSALETYVRLKEGYDVREQKQHESSLYNNFGCLEDIANVMVKQEQDEGRFIKGDLGSGSYSFSKCM
ncbi:hypothetical protein K2173_025811 [Erythroxylum novogranatense]|uniref:Two-component response regulator n=1 Tax=Erythroxylum novogranatense TaxID=1862640 RepID=A0AAV8SHF4_9ROSI|nr:hypothetical protein K2173_025811 [Erythroxylum novogranatense]